MKKRKVNLDNLSQENAIMIIALNKWWRVPDQRELVKMILQLEDMVLDMSEQLKRKDKQIKTLKFKCNRHE